MRIRGAVAGLTALGLLLSTGCPNDDTSAPAPEPDPGSAPVTILIIDDFDLEADKAPPPPLDADGDHCAYVGGGAGGYGSKGAYVRAQPAPGAPVEFRLIADKPHGDFVFDQLKGLLNAAGLQLESNQPTFAQTKIAGNVRSAASWRTPTNDRVVLVGADTKAYKTKDITQRIDELVDATQARLHIPNLVLNMSIEILPCDVSDLSAKELAKEYEEIIGKFPELEALQEKLDEATKIDNPDEQLQALLTRPEFYPMHLYLTYETDLQDNSKLLRDPLRGLLDEYVKESLTAEGGELRIVPVAAAGNSDLPLPALPAAWDSVVSTSARPIPPSDEGQPPLEYSNQGEVLFDGRTTDPQTGITVFGSSFAAPVAATLLARYLHSGLPYRCMPSALGPPLKYAAVDSKVYPPEYENATPLDAADKTCGSPLPHFDENNLASFW